jgi:hypothetical protein
MASYEEDLFNELYGGGYLKADDFEGVSLPKKVRIGKVEPLDLRQIDGSGTKKKFVVSFVGVDKGLPLNKGNARSIASAFGKHFPNWPGNMVELSVVDTDNGRKGISVTPLANCKPVPDSEPDEGDDIPF